MNSFDKFYDVDFVLLAIAKRWIKCPLFVDVIHELVKAYKQEYCDLSKWEDEAVAKIIAERWFDYTKQLSLFSVKEFVENMNPAKSCMIKYGSEDLGYHSSCLRAIIRCVMLIESSKLPGFHIWLKNNGYCKE